MWKKTCKHTHVQPPHPMSSGSTTPQVTDVLSGLLQKFPGLRIHHGPLPPPWHGENDGIFFGVEMDGTAFVSQILKQTHLIFPNHLGKHYNIIIILV